MGGIVYYASLDNPQLEQVEVELFDVELIDVNSIENKAKLQISFLVKILAKNIYCIIYFIRTFR